MATEAHQRFEELVRNSGLPEDAQRDWLAFGEALDDDDLMPYVELLQEEPESLLRMNESVRLADEYLRTQDPDLLKQIRKKSMENLNELLES